MRSTVLLISAAIAIVACASRTEAPLPLPRNELFWSQPSAAIKLSFSSQLLAAMAEQRKVWKAEEDGAHAAGETNAARAGLRQRLINMHCHVDGSFDGL